MVTHTKDQGPFDQTAPIFCVTVRIKEAASANSLNLFARL